MKGDEVIKEEIEIISIMILLEEARERYIQENGNDNKMEFIRNHKVKSRPLLFQKNMIRDGKSNFKDSIDTIIHNEAEMVNETSVTSGDIPVPIHSEAEMIAKKYEG